MLGRLVDLAEHAAARELGGGRGPGRGPAGLLVAARPLASSSPPALGRLVELAAADQPLARLGPLSEDELANTLAAAAGRAAQRRARRRGRRRQPRPAAAGGAPRPQLAGVGPHHPGRARRPPRPRSARPPRPAARDGCRSWDRRRAEAAGRALGGGAARPDPRRGPGGRPPPRRERVRRPTLELVDAGLAEPDGLLAPAVAASARGRAHPAGAGRRRGAGGRRAGRARAAAVGGGGAPLAGAPHRCRWGGGLPGRRGAAAGPRTGAGTRRGSAGRWRSTATASRVASGCSVRSWPRATPRGPAGRSTVLLRKHPGQ